MGSAWFCPVAASSVSLPAMVSVCLEPGAQVKPVGECSCPSGALSVASACMLTHTHTCSAGLRPQTKDAAAPEESLPAAGAGPMAYTTCCPPRAYLAPPATARPARACPYHPLMRQPPPSDGPCGCTDQFVSTEGRELQSKPIMRVPLHSGHADRGVGGICFLPLSG